VVIFVVGAPVQSLSVAARETRRCLILGRPRCFGYAG